MIEVRVPATSANIGPGFDCLGIALNLYNYFSFEEIESGLIIEGCEPIYANSNNLIYVSMKECFEKIGYEYKGIRIKVKNNIPISRGLGSSAACIIGGIVGANELAGGVLDKEQILQLATEIEGHPDNVAPALLGGMTVAVAENKQVYYSKFALRGLKFCVLIPDFRLSTEKARAVLPQAIPYKDAVFNVGRVSLLLAGLLNNQLDLLKMGCTDRLHQPYRGKLIPDYDKIINECTRLDVLGSFLSGAGPTIMVLLKEDDDRFVGEISKFLSQLNSSWEVKELSLDEEGLFVQNPKSEYTGGNVKGY